MPQLSPKTTLEDHNVPTRPSNLGCSSSRACIVIRTTSNAFDNTLSVVDSPALNRCVSLYALLSQHTTGARYIGCILRVDKGFFNEEHAIRSASGMFLIGSIAKRIVVLCANRVVTSTRSPSKGRLDTHKITDHSRKRA